MPHRDTLFRYHRAVSDEGITYYPRQNGGAWKADSDGFESNCPVSNVHELAIATHVISNNGPCIYRPFVFRFSISW